MRIEWMHCMPGQRVGYFATVVVDQRAVADLGVDVAVFGAIDRARVLSGDRRSLRLVFDSTEELNSAALFVYERALRPVTATPHNHALLLEFFSVQEIALTLATEARPST